MLIESIESLDKHTVGRGAARTTAEENMCVGPDPLSKSVTEMKHVDDDTH